MKSIDLVLQAILLGLSTGVYCLGHCLPVVFPLVFSEDKSSLKSRGRLILEFGIGRLMAYLAFGALVGYLGHELSHPFVQKSMAAMMIVLAIFLMIYGFRSNNSSKKKFCQILSRAAPSRNFPFLFGILTGVNLCPPFLIAIGYIFNLGEISKGVLFFLAFYFATSVFLLPFIFLGYFSRYEKLRWIAQMSTILAGGLFFWMGFNQLVL